MDRVRNEGVSRRAEVEWELASKADQIVLRWFGHVDRMDEYHIARRVLMAEVNGGRVQGRQVRLDGWCKSGLGQQKSDGGGCMSKKRVESTGTYFTE